MKTLSRVLLIILVIALIGMIIASVAKARAAVNRSDAYIRYLDEKYGW